MTFIAAAILGHVVQDAISSRANDIITNAMPSVKVLSAARGDLRDLDSAVEHSQLEGDRASEAATVARQNMQQSLKKYVDLPRFPNERERLVRVSEALSGLDGRYETWRASPTPATLSALRTDIARVDEALEQMVAFNAEQGQRLSREISRIREHSFYVVLVVDAIVVVLAAGATILALRQLRRAARASQREQQASVQREAELREANIVLGQFAGRVAHDVRSPLAATMLAIDLIGDRCGSDPAVQRAVDRGLASLRRMNRIVEGLLAFAVAGGKPEADAAADVSSVLSDLIDGLAMQAKEKKIALVLDPVPAGAATACRPGVLTSIVSNLVENAIKYMSQGPERRITVRVADSGGNWRFEVSDTGPGIPEREQQRIFEPYVRASNAGAGIGLGLATVERLVHAHAGELGVWSTLGAGSTFWFELPKSRGIAPSDAVEPRSAPPVPA